MNFNYKSPELTDADVAELTTPAKRDYSVVEPGRYAMKIKDVSARVMPSGKVVGEVRLEHTEARGAKYATLALFKAKDNPAQDSEVTTKFLVTIGKALGLPAEKLRTISWGDAADADVNEYGRKLAAILVSDGNGGAEALDVSGVELTAILDVRKFQKRDGTEGAENEVKAIYPAR